MRLIIAVLIVSLILFVILSFKTKLQKIRYDLTAEYDILSIQSQLILYLKRPKYYHMRGILYGLTAEYGWSY